MRILFKDVYKSDDGVFTYSKDLINVLSDNGHQCYYSGEECYIRGGVFDPKFRYHAYDLVIDKKVVVHPTAPTLTHLHNAIVSNGVKDTLRRRKGEITISMNSEYQKIQLEESGIDTKDMHIIPNMVDEWFYVPSLLKRKKNSVLCFGSISYYNRNTILTLIRAIHHLPYRVTMVGKVEEQFVQELRGEDLSRVHIYGRARNNAEKKHLINSHSIGVGVGRAMMEMILCGLPVMLFGLGYNGYVKECDLSFLRRANYTTRMMLELSEEEKIERIRNDINSPTVIDRAVAEQWFGLRKNIKVYENLYHTIKSSYDSNSTKIATSSVVSVPEQFAS